jgi:hypothetical protein
MITMPELSKLFLMSLCSALVSACSSDMDSAAGSGASMSGAGSSAAAAPDCDATHNGFAVGENGLLATDPNSGISVRVLDGPVPPNFGYNTWTIALQDKTGAPASDAHLTWACAYMSVHGHGSNPKAVENLGGGKYKLTDQFLRMFGPWEVQLWIDPTGAEPEYASQGAASLIGGNACTPTAGLMGKPTVELKICVPRSSGD